MNQRAPSNPVAKSSNGQQLTGMNTYLINLDRSPDRLAFMTAKLQALDLSFERVAAVDGKKLKFPIPQFSARAYKYLHGRRTAPSEVGCYLSHVRCAQNLLDSQATHALILEDDVEFDPDFVNILDAALAEQNQWDILRLSTVNTGHKFPFYPLTEHHHLAITLTREKGAGAYVVNRKAARWIVEDLIPMRLAYDIAFDLEFFAGLKAAYVTPVPVKQNLEFPTLIQNGIRKYRLPAWRYFTVFPYRVWLETGRVICRTTRLIQLRLRKFAGKKKAS